MSNKKEIAQFLEDRFGMFIHWGIYAVPARIEWLRSTEKMSKAQYDEFIEDFDASRCDPKQWAKLAKAAGQKYAVFTSKHHDGFCLYDSQLTDYKITNSPAKRDIVREYLDAFREEGIKVGLYFSIIDWAHEDYPAYNDRIHPDRGNEAIKDKEINFDNYLTYMHGQVKELLTNYGKLDIMWFDFSYDDMVGEKWRATELMEMVRSIQPHIIIDNRLGEDNLLEAKPAIYAGDFYSPEQIIPPQGVLNAKGEQLPWEACITLNDHWGYNSRDKEYKSAKQVVRSLIECVSKNGNLLLNVAPDGKGEISAIQHDILSEVGEWLRLNGDSIYGCAAANLPKPEWGRYTKKGNKLYAHILDRGIGATYFQGLKGKVKKARLLSDGSELIIHIPWTAKQYSDITSGVFIDFKGASLPCDISTVVEFTLTEDI